MTVQLKIGDVETALDFYNQASVLYGDNQFETSKVLMELGMAYRRLNNFEKAVEYSDRAFSIFAGLENIIDTLKLQVAKAVIFGEAGGQKEAENLLQTAINKYSEYGQQAEEE